MKVKMEFKPTQIEKLILYNQCIIMQALEIMMDKPVYRPPMLLTAVKNTHMFLERFEEKE